LRVRISPSFKKRLRKKTAAQTGPILECIKKLEENPQSHGLRVKKMGGRTDIYEARVDHGNRLTFRMGDEDTIELLNHCNHDILRR
jgi:mRNA-degrading endonuclease RelE of RelBE toxin-antitoxin system